MSTRQLIDVRNNDCENLNARLAGKAGLQPSKGIVTKRAPLGELGNKIQTHNVVKNDGKNVSKIMAPPKAVAKKPVVVKSTVNTTNTTTTNCTLNSTAAAKKVEKNVPVKPFIREESILKNLACEDDTAVTSYSTKQLMIVDPDQTSKNDPQMVTEYLSDIFSYLREMETKYPVKEKHLEESESTPKMRAILINWLVEVNMNFKFCLETLHLCVSLVDRYLQAHESVGRDILQLVGVSALLVASKYEEIYIPEIDDFVYICDNTFTKRQILQMEIKILKTIDFNLGRPLSIHFLRRYSKVAQVQVEEHTLAKYLLELALLDYDMACIKPSIQAAAACCLSISILNDVINPAKVWTPTLTHYTTYQYSQFKSVVVGLAHLILKIKTAKQQAIYKKYASSSNSKISLNHKLYAPTVQKLTAASKKL